MTSRHARGFSLIEVLIAIVVLALGLLGLASVFPMVVGQQKQATDSVQGVALERSAAEALASHARLSQASRDLSGNGQIEAAEERGWDVCTRLATWSRTGRWVLAEDTGPNSAMEYHVDGRVELRGADAAAQFVIPPVLRLAPMAESLSVKTEPRYVWDFVARRVDAGATNDPANTRTFGDDAVQVVVFVRALDPGIRRPTAGLPGGVVAFLPAAIRQGLIAPVAVDPATGVPTGDGRGDYSHIRRFQYQFPVPANRSLIAIDSDAALGVNLRRYAALVGQKFVDQVGVVHTVVRVSAGPGAADPPRAVLDTPVSPQVDRVTLDQGQTDPHMLFTPQVPVAVSVRTIQRRPL
jgi:prepilin-type N-terminal cleavage/methylation domain-containing protein